MVETASEGPTQTSLGYESMKSFELDVITGVAFWHYMFVVLPLSGHVSDPICVAISKGSSHARPL